MGTVRCLLLAKNYPEKWKMFLKLESLERQRRGSMQWKADLESIGKFIPRYVDTQTGQYYPFAVMCLSYINIIGFKEIRALIVCNNT